MNDKIKNLTESNDEISKLLEHYNKIFEEALHLFIDTNHLDGDVIRPLDSGKIEKGRIEIVKNVHSGRNAQIIPYYVIFHPYKKDGTLSAAHRADDLSDINSPREYFEETLSRYKSAEDSTEE